MDCFVHFMVSQSAFVRGFIDDRGHPGEAWAPHPRLNPRSCAASSMTCGYAVRGVPIATSQSAFVRGFIDDTLPRRVRHRGCHVSIRVRARLHR